MSVLSRRRGIVYILALMVLAITAVMAVAFAAQNGLNLAQSDNYCTAMQARLASESGMTFALYQIKSLRVPQPTDAASLANSFAQALQTRLNGTANLGAALVAVSGNTVTVPPVTINGRTFDCVFVAQSATLCRLTVTGTAYGVSRRTRMDLNVIVKRSGAFDYGFATRGQFCMSGNARIMGVNSPSEASILSTTTSTTSAITISGNTAIGGDLSVTGGTTIGISGAPTIGNTSNPALWPGHCHFDVTPPEFPQYDTAPLAPLATTIIDSNTNLNAGTFSNVRIKAGTNPSFSSKTTFNGIVYIEVPNKVSFTGQVTINGLIVTQQATPSQLNDCQISFSGGVEAYGVEVLPNTAQYAAVKQQTGTFILAPGFGLTFSGHVTAVNGNIAADQLTFTGTAEGTVRGSVIGLRDIPNTLGGTVDIYVDRRNAVQDPAGFIVTCALSANPDTYSEVLPGE